MTGWRASFPWLATESRHVYWQRAARLARERWRPFLAFCALMLVLNLFRTWAFIPLDDPIWTANAHIRTGLGSLVSVTAMFGAIVLSEAAGLRGVRHAFASLGALATAVTSATFVLMWLSDGVFNRSLVEGHYIVSDAAFIGRTFWIDVAGGMLLVAYFAIKEREAASARFARAVELERARAQRVTMAARLKVMQARVEPELLFGVLAEVRRIYEHDLDAANALLDDLITYLRAALPQMRSEASTVDREVALADAYLKLLPAARSGYLNVDVRQAGERERHPFPPMVLLPMVQAAADSFTRRITLAVHAANQGPMEVTVEVDPPLQPAGWSDERLAALRTTLTQYFGASAHLTVQGSRATVQWTDFGIGGARPTWEVSPSLSSSPV